MKLVHWWFEPLPRGRIAALRTILYLFIFVDVLFTTSWIAGHGDIPEALYQPLFLGRTFPLPTPTPLVADTVKALLLVFAALAATGRAPRALGTAVFLLYVQWMLIGFSYGKVDHDRVAFIVALAVLPTVGRARWGDRTADEASGWALRSIQVAAVLTYLLATFAKLRFGGIEWLWGATLMRAVLRRGTFLVEPLTDHPEVLVVAQFLIVAFELSAPLLLVRGRIGRIWLALAVIFHLVTYASITIIFLPHVVSLLSFVPLERMRRPALIAGRRLAHARAVFPSQLR